MASLAITSIFIFSRASRTPPHPMLALRAPLPDSASHARAMRSAFRVITGLALLALLLASPAHATPTPTPTVLCTPAATPTPLAGLDAYGGQTALACPSGSAAHFYTQQIGNRWWICDPAGHAFFMKGLANNVPNVDSGLPAIIASKYATGATAVADLNWVTQMVKRMLSWGFNTVADDSYLYFYPGNTDVSWGTGDNTIPSAQRMPYAYGVVSSSRYMFSGTDCATPIKDQINGISSYYTGQPYDYGDYFDPNYASCLASIVTASGINGLATGIHNDYLLYITFDESDQTGGLISSAGQDYATYPPGKNVSGHPGWVTLAANPVQTTGSANWGSPAYTDCNDYTKLQLIANLVTEYGTIGGLNTAWGSSYTGFYSSQSGLTTAGNWGSGHANCSGYTSYGTGTGLLDENGHDAWLGNDLTLAGETSAMQADLHTFYVAYLDQYLSIERSAWLNGSTGAPGVMLQEQFGGWGSPPRAEALTEAAKYVDIPQITLPMVYYCSNAACATDQAVQDFIQTNLGNKPYLTWLGIDANPDSSQSAFSSSVGSPYTTQAQRDTGYDAELPVLLADKDTATGTHHVVGFYWWDAYDMNSEELNWGWITPSDNVYDGCAASVGGEGNDWWGYPTGGETANYGNFVGTAAGANILVESEATMSPTPSAAGHIL
jgi:hypothetical protein